MKNTGYFIFVIICLIPNLLFAQTNHTISAKRVPIVVYTPFNFHSYLMDAFNCGEGHDYYVVTENKTFVHNNRIGAEYYKGEYCTRQLREAPILNISDFKHTILSNDSCFFFAPTPTQKYNNEYLGIKRGDSISFIDKDGNAYETLEELLTKIYNAESLDVFYEAYLTEIRNALYHRGTHNMLYQIYDDNQAISLLKDNYDFIYFYDQDVESAINNFIDYVNSIIHNESICKQLKKDLKKLVVERPCIGNIESFNKAFREYVLNKSEDCIYLMLMDITSTLKHNLTEHEYKIFSKRHIIYQNKVIAAYEYLARKYQKNVNNNGIISWDPMYGDIVNYITRTILFPKGQVACKIE